MTSDAPVETTRLQQIGLFLGPALFGLTFLIAAPEPITTVGFERVGLLAFAVCWWIAGTLPIAVTTLAVLACGVATGILSLTEAFANSGNWVLYFTIGAFGIGAALETTGVNRRVALAFLDQPWVRGRPYAFLSMFLLSGAMLHSVMANTVVAVVWLSLAMTILKMLKVEPGHSLAEATSMGIAWMANIGGISTPVGTATNTVAIGMIATTMGVSVSFAQWTIVGSVLSVLMMASMLLVLRFVVKPDVEPFQREETVEFVRSERAKLGPMPPAEKRAVAWLLVAIGLWLVPDLSRFLISPEIAKLLSERLALAVPALLVPIGMCLTPVPGSPGRRVLTWKEWAGGVEWGMVLFIGGVMALGAAVGAESTGLPAYMKLALEPHLGGLSEYAFVFVLSLTVILVTSVISNLVTLAIFLPLGLTLSQSLGIGDPVALGMMLGIAPSLDFILPSGTTTNAIIIGSGYLRVGTMLRYGLFLIPIHTCLLTFVGYPLAKFVLALWR
ncbi:MAG: SLC13 family permease [Vicinamibacteria bacterium]